MNIQNMEYLESSITPCGFSHCKVSMCDEWQFSSRVDFFSVSLVLGFTLLLNIQLGSLGCGFSK